MSLVKVLKFVGGSIIEKPFEIVGRQLEFYQQRKNAAHDQKLKQEEAKFMQSLEFDRQKFNAELDDMIARKEIERGSLVAKAIADYQKTMAECTISIGKSLGMMNIELRERATALVEDKQKQYWTKRRLSLKTFIRNFLKRVVRARLWKTPSKSNSTTLSKRPIDL